MNASEIISYVVGGYLAAQKETFKGHNLATTLRDTLPNAIRSLLPNDPLLIVTGSPGQGRWVFGPWVAIFDQQITNSAQSGFYPVFLFREDMSGLYLSLNQAMTEAKRDYKADAKTALRARAANFRAILGPGIAPFNAEPIDLRPSAKGNDTAFYEAGNICSIFYSADAIPSEIQIQDNIQRMLTLYRKLIDTPSASDEDTEDQEPGVAPMIEDRSKFRMHKRIERNPALIKKVKKVKGCRCEACDVCLEERYGSIGTGYIEAHHLNPVSSLKDTVVTLDPRLDFAVLCANCHRMIHRLDDVADVQFLKSLVKS